MMKRSISLAVVLALGVVVCRAQILRPVSWSYGAKKISPTEALVFLKATIDAGWHLYSQHVKAGGPIPTTIRFDKSADYVLEGKTAEPKPVVRMEPTFNMHVAFFEKTVIFQQKIKLKKNQTTVTGVINYMTCDDKQCLPPDDVKFSIPIN